MTENITNISGWRYRRTATAAADEPHPEGHRRGQVSGSSSGSVPPLGQVLRGDALTVLRKLPPASFDCVTSSPPYFLLRSYSGGNNEVGTETNVEAFVDRLVEVCDELARVLTNTGTMFLNLGDSFSRGPRYGAPAKSMLLAPERLLLRLVEHGWLVRSKVIWAKPNPMPNSVRDRFASTHESVFFLVRSEHYPFDLDAVREPHKTTRRPGPMKVDAKYGGSKPPWAGPLAGANDGLEKTRAEGRAGHPLGKNPGDVWRIATAAFRGGHWAVFPEALVRRPLLVGCPERVCLDCGTPWERERRRDRLGTVQAVCECSPARSRAGRVLDPFMGSGTVGVVAEQVERDWLGIELNPAFAAMAEARIAASRQQRETTNERRTA